MSKKKKGPVAAIIVEHPVESWLRAIRDLSDSVGIEDTAESLLKLQEVVEHMRAGVAIETTHEDRS